MRYFIAAIIIFCTYALAYADGNDEPIRPAQFQPWQQIWQCNDIRVTVTAPNYATVNYDIGGTIWGGINFTLWQGRLFLRGIPCAPLSPVAY